MMMSEPTGWDAPAAENLSPVTPQPGVQPAAAPDQESLGMQVAVAGGSATDVDTTALLRQIQALQGRVETMEREKRLEQAPEVVKYAQSLADHLQAKADAHPVIHADPDYTFHPVLEKAKALIGSANAAADSGNPADVVRIADDIGKWITRHARQFTSLDYGYVQQLIEDVHGASDKLAA